MVPALQWGWDDARGGFYDKGAALPGRGEKARPTRSASSCFASEHPLPRLFCDITFPDDGFRSINSRVIVGRIGKLPHVLAACNVTCVVGHRSHLQESRQCPPTTYRKCLELMVKPP